MAEQIRFQFDIKENHPEQAAEPKKSAVIRKKRIAQGIPVACTDEYGNAYLEYMDGSKKYVN